MGGNFDIGVQRLPDSRLSTWKLLILDEGFGFCFATWEVFVNFEVVICQKLAIICEMIYDEEVYCGAVLWTLLSYL